MLRIRLVLIAEGEGLPPVIPEEDHTIKTNLSAFGLLTFIVCSLIKASFERSQTKSPMLRIRLVLLAEGEGFEPPVPQRYNGFQDRRVRPLRQPSR